MYFQDIQQGQLTGNSIPVLACKITLILMNESCFFFVAWNEKSREDVCCVTEGFGRAVHLPLNIVYDFKMRSYCNDQVIVDST